MSAPIQLALAARPHRNQQLFSDYYLDHILPKRGDWRLLISDSSVKGAKARIKAIFDAFTPSQNEAQTERDLVRPVLEALGHVFEVQPPLVTPDGAKRPDYVFYRDGAARDANKNKQLNEALLAGTAYAVGDAKFWARPLDVAIRIGSDPFNNKNPSYQIAFYMQHSGVEWGVLTDGRLWRLYGKDTAHKLDRFYEVDLPSALASDDDEAFLYFYAFFHRAAFEPHSLGVAEILRASRDYAHGVSDSLKTQVYQVLRHVAQGFLDYAPNRLLTDPDVLKEIYDNSLIVLYRMLFILYAEARELLPVNESAAYRDEYSLRAIKEEVRRNLVQGRQLLPTTTRLWHKLTELCAIINDGSPPLKVATYNGGLFDPQKHPFLTQHAVGDVQLQQAIDKLARVDGEFIDYRDLAERHLGTIYEGLLEYHLSPAQSSAPPSAPVEGNFSIDLLNDKGERKATGSYYTPDYIVKYMVDQALGPLLRDMASRSMTDRDKINAILALNVLDPAMGSGHFLVEAVEYIAQFLVELGIEGEPPSPRTNGLGAGASESNEGGDVGYWKRRVAQSCVYGVDLNPLAVELAKLSLWLTTVAKDRPLSFLDHHLRPGNSLAGASLEDIRNARFAAPKKKLKKAASANDAQEQLFDAEDLRRNMSLAVDSMFLIEANQALTVGDVKAQEQVYTELRATLTERYRKLADLITVSHFGAEIPPDLRKPLADLATGRESIGAAQVQPLLDRALEAARQMCFFHWELEFPEVFFDKQGEWLGNAAGFDAVIGNPPYVRQEELSPFKPFFQSEYASYHGTADLYLYFYERGVKLIQHDGRLAYISSGTFARANFATPFRRWLPTQARIESLIDFGENQPFEGAEMVRPSIVVLKKLAHTQTLDSSEESEVLPSSIFRSLFITGKIPASLDSAMATEGIDCDPDVLRQPEWVFQAASGTKLLSKILSKARRLDQVVVEFYRGVTTGLNDVFVINQSTRDELIRLDPHCSELIHVVLQGEDMRPWYQENEGRWLIFTRRGVNIDQYPSIKAYLMQHRSHLEPRPHGLEERATRAGRKAGVYKWFEIQDAIDYFEAFSRRKIVWSDISKLPRFSMDDEGKFVLNTGFIIPTDDPSLLGLLQSRVTWFAVSQICTPLRLRAGLWQYRMIPQFVARLPIPDLSTDERAAIGGLAMQITQLARERYALHRRARERIGQDLSDGATLNTRLTAWWELDFPTFRAEAKKAFKRDIAVRERDEWAAWLAAQRADHERLTAEIVRLEIDLNQRVYMLYNLTPSEIALIEESTKYCYGEV